MKSIETREPFALDERYGEPLLCEEGGGRGAGRAPANDEHVTHCGAETLLFCRKVRCSNDFCLS